MAYAFVTRKPVEIRSELGMLGAHLLHSRAPFSCEVTTSPLCITTPGVPRFISRSGAKLALEDKATLRVQILIDRSWVEVFADEGRVAITNRIYPDAQSVGGRLREGRRGIFAGF